MTSESVVCITKWFGFSFFRLAINRVIIEKTGLVSYGDGEVGGFMDKIKRTTHQREASHPVFKLSLDTVITRL